MSECVKRNVFVAGHCGMVGSAILRQLNQVNDIQVITRTRDELDLTNQKAVADFFSDNSIDQVYLAAAKVGGFMLITLTLLISSMKT